MKIRYLVRFEKRGNLKFIGHLDLLRLLQRCVRLAGIDIDYSKGFNPHMLIFIALPLAVGMEGRSEYAVFEMKTETGEEEILCGINKAAPQGLRVLGVRGMSDAEKNPASLVRAAEFEVILDKASGLKDIIEEIRVSETLTVEKQGGKHGGKQSAKQNGKQNENIQYDKQASLDAVKTSLANAEYTQNSAAVSFTDIRECIYDIFPADEKTVVMKLAQGSILNLKPYYVIKHICGKMGFDYFPHKISCARNELYKFDGNENLVKLFDM